MATLKEKWQAVQRWAGTPADGDPGPKTVDALLARIGLVPEPTPIPSTGLVKGTGKNIRNIFIHCTATKEGAPVSVETIRGWHKKRGWSDIGYHFVIGLDGKIERGRPEDKIGSHVAGFNTGSIGVVYVGGLDHTGKAKDTRTQAQKNAMEDLVRALTDTYVGAKVLGHRDASPDLDGDGVVEPHEWLKECPCFDVSKWWNEVK